MEQETIFSIGQLLQQERNNKGLSLEEISEITKIKVRILENVEANEFEKLGGPGYAKAIIYSYGKALEIDNLKLSEMINERFSDKTKHNAKFNSIQPKKMLIPVNLFPIILLIILVIVFIIMAIQMSKAGTLKSPFKKDKVKIEKVEKKIDEIENKKSELEKKSQKKELENSGKISIKPKMFQDAAKLESEKSESKVTLNRAALRDTTNFLNNLMFKEKSNPFLKK
ncbi:MAG: helix-turn-helix domain-containing protein [Candidatus Cloacimonetes bacterium]|nr:helix-turn-helix domain-containing protein [Candidatus Cloacimonadota bacterium]